MATRETYCARCRERCERFLEPDVYEPTAGGGIRLVRRNARRRRNLPILHRKNPRRVRPVGVIPGYMTEARYYREGENRGHYRHMFKPESKVKMIAMSDGSVWLRGTRRIHADDKRPGFGRYTGGNPNGGGRMASRNESSFVWYVVLGLGLYWILSTRSASAGGLPGVGANPNASPAPLRVSPGVAVTGTPQYDSSNVLFGYAFASANGGVNIFAPTGELIGTS